MKSKYILIVILILCFVGTASATWNAALNDFNYRQLHNLTGETTWTSNQTNYEVKFTIYNTSGSSSGSTVYTNGHTQTDWDDLRFTNYGGTILDYWVESTAATYAVVWVEVDSIHNSSTATQMYVYYGYSSASAYSNGDNTFDFYDHFLVPSGSINTTKWITISGAPVVASSILTMVTAGGRDIINSLSMYGNGYAYRLYAKMEQTGNAGNQMTGFYDQAALTKAVILLHNSPTAGGRNNLYVYDAAASSTSWLNAGDVYNLFEVFRTSTYANVTRDGVQVGTTITTNIPSANLNITFDSQADGSGVILADWCFVRNLATPEPSHSTWFAEENNIPPVAAFSGNVTEGYPEFAVYFTDASTNTPTAWDWYFPNGGDAHTQNATWTFDYWIGNTVTGYNVSLNASNEYGYDWENKTFYIWAYPLNASFTANVTAGNVPLPVLFTDMTNNGTASNWSWDFGDGNTSFDQNPTNTFGYTGLFNVTLNASNLYSWDIEEKTFYINATEATPTPTPTPTAAPTPADLNASYFGEETTIPFEIFVLAFGAGMCFLVLSVISGFSYNAGLTMIFGLIATLFLAVSAYASPVTGFYSYITNTSANASPQATPVVWLIFQPWMMWLLWGMSLIAFLLFVFGILLLFREHAHEDEMEWV